MAQYLTCPFCGFEFEKLDTLCAHGCPVGAWCNLIRCPSCQYEFPERPRKVTWLRRLLRTPLPESAPLPAGVRAVTQLKDGEDARVLCLGGHSPSLQNTLAVFGLVPGADITLVQRLPSCVLRVGETELALDSDIARQILVEHRPHEQLPPPSPPLQHPDRN